MSDHWCAVVNCGVLMLVAVLTVGFAVYLVWLPKPSKSRKDKR